MNINMTMTMMMTMNHDNDDEDADDTEDENEGWMMRMIMKENKRAHLEHDDPSAAFKKGGVVQLKAGADSEINSKTFAAGVFLLQSAVRTKQSQLKIAQY